MDESEQLVNKYLLSLGLGSVVYEPDGNVPPDFSVNTTIAVEVRRLNQNFKKLDGSTEGLEQLAIPLWQRLQKLLPTIAQSLNGESWFIGMDFRRPVEPWRTLEDKIIHALSEFMNRPFRQQTTIYVTDNFNLDVIRASSDHGSFFTLGASSDDDSGGWILGEVEKNLNLCIEEKDKKITKYFLRYSEWWLVLVDHIGLGVDEFDQHLYRNHLAKIDKKSWGKVILLSPRNYLNAFTI